jgi:TldD protein
MSKNPPQSLKIASKLLLKPYDLDFEDLDKVFGKLFRHKLDYADLYFQYHRSEAWSLEEGIVKSGSFNIEQGLACAPSPARRRPSPTPTTSA